MHLYYRLAYQCCPKESPERHEAVATRYTGQVEQRVGDLYGQRKYRS